VVASKPLVAKSSRRKPLTADRLRHLLRYDPTTGTFEWRPDAQRNNPYSGQTAGVINQEGYVAIRVDMRIYYAHRLAWLYVYGVWPRNRINHRNKERADNRLKNLREATHAQTVWTSRRPKTNRSGYKGVSSIKQHQKWRARIRVNGKVYCLGTFETKEAAATAYADAAKRLRGEYAPAAS
jgi:hypothetical protein